MTFNYEKYLALKAQLEAKKVTLVAVSKMKRVEDIQKAYDAGIRDFGENYVQELQIKIESLPGDIRWHFIGHLQTNKVKLIAGKVHLIHGIDSEKLLKEINKQGEILQQKLPCLLQVHIATEETKFGFDADSVIDLDLSAYPFAAVKGLMGMASFSDDHLLVKSEFEKLKKIYDGMQSKYAFEILSMGMSNDYEIAIEAGSNMVRIGSLLFGNR